MPAGTLGLISCLRAGASAGPEIPDRRIAAAPAGVPPEMMIVAERAGRAEGSGWHPAVAAVRPLGEIRLVALAVPLLAVRAVSRAQPCPDLAPAEGPDGRGAPDVLERLPTATGPSGYESAPAAVPVHCTSSRVASSRRPPP